MGLARRTAVGWTGRTDSSWDSGVFAPVVEDMLTSYAGGEELMVMYTVSAGVFATSVAIVRAPELVRVHALEMQDLRGE